jgi:hypothetical protein
VSRATKNVSPSMLDRARAWLGRQGPTFRVVIPVLLGAVILAAAFMLFPRWPDGSFARELVVAALGAVITIVAAAVTAAVALSRELVRRREVDVLQRFDGKTWERRSLRVGRMEIDDIVVVASGGHQREWTDGVTLTFAHADGPRRVPDDIAAARDARVPLAVAERDAQSIALTNDPCVDLVAAKVQLTADDAGRRRRSYHLTCAEARYFDFLATTAELDREGSGGAGRTLRERAPRQPATIEDVSSLPAMAKIGVGTAVITTDGMLVLGVRGRVAIAGQTGGDRREVHIVAEGMVPGDLDRQGSISPARTSLRGVEEELGISGARDSLGRVTSHGATGFFFDQLRWQPCFAYIARVDLTWDELQTAASTARDYWEMETLLALPFTIENPGMRYLLTDSHPDLVLASNHAAAVVYFALLHEHGFSAMRDALTDSGSVYRPSTAS